MNFTNHSIPLPPLPGEWISCGWQTYIFDHRTWRTSPDEWSAQCWGPWATRQVKELILQPFRHFTYVTTHSPTLPSLCSRHSSFSNPSFASPTSQALHLIHLASRPCLGHLRDNTNIKDYAHHSLTHIHSSKAGMRKMIVMANDIRRPGGRRASWHLSYRWGKIPEKTSARKLSRPVIEPGPVAWQPYMISSAP